MLSNVSAMLNMDLWFFLVCVCIVLEHALIDWEHN